MWKIVRASVTGTSHVSAGKGCEDSCFADCFKTSAGDALVALASDGAGSAAKGGLGAEICCSVAAQAIEHHLAADASLTDDIVLEWIREVRRALHDEAETLGLGIRELACTLVGAVVSPQSSVFFQVGDGAIVTHRGDVHGVVFWPDNGEYANMTYFVTDDDAIDHVQVQTVHRVFDEVAIFTDGLQRLALSFEHKAPHTPFFEPMFKTLRNIPLDKLEQLDHQLAIFLGSERVCEQTDDDKTLVLATRLT